MPVFQNVLLVRDKFEGNSEGFFCPGGQWRQGIGVLHGAHGGLIDGKCA